MMSIFSTETGDFKILSSTLDADTTTSCPKIETSASSTERLEIPPVISTSFVPKPTMENTKVNGGSWLTFKVNLPERSVIVPITFPFTRMFTPTNVSFVSASVTVPEMVV